MLLLYPFARLRLDHEGGRLYSTSLLFRVVPFLRRPDIRFAWEEVERAEKVRLARSWEEGVRFTLRSSRQFTFDSRNDGDLSEVLDVAESRGVIVTREASS